MSMADYRARRADYVLCTQMLGTAAPTDVQFRDWLRAVTRLVQTTLDTRNVAD